MSSIDFLESQLHAYSKHIEGWKVDHDDAMECLDLQVSIQAGNNLFALIVALDEEMRFLLSKMPLKKRAKYDHGLEKILVLFEQWILPTPSVVAAIDRLEGLGFEVSGASLLRSNIAECTGILTPDAEFFGEGLADVRDASVEESRGGLSREWT